MGTLPPPPLATQESVDHLTKLVEALHVKIDKLFATPSSTVSQTTTGTELSQKTANVSYASIVRALAESEKIKDKSQRAVLVGSSEKATPEETANHDEKVLQEIIQLTHDKDLKEAYTSGSITHKRFPENKQPGRRIVKYSLPSTALRDRLLAAIRTVGRPASFEPSMFLRRDLMPSELEQERAARDEARKRNNEAGCLKWGVRDCELIKFRGPNYRPLPSGYRNLTESKPVSISNQQTNNSVNQTSATANESKSIDNSDSVSTSGNTTKTASTDFVTTRKKDREEKPEPTPSPPLSSSGGQTAKDLRAPTLH